MLIMMKGVNRNHWLAMLSMKVTLRTGPRTQCTKHRSFQFPNSKRNLVLSTAKQKQNHFLRWICAPSWLIPSLALGASGIGSKPPQPYTGHI